MRYLADTPALADIPHLRVGSVPDGAPPPVLTLGVEPEIALPAGLCADTAAAVALRLLRGGGGAERSRGIEAVTAARFTGDYLLAIWALCEPEEALRRAEQIDDAARACAYGVYRSEQALQIACFLRAYPGESGIDDPAALYQALLPEVARLLDTPRAFDLYWIGEYSDVMRAEHLLNSGAVQIDDYPELDLTVVQTPLRLHDFTLYTAAAMFRVLIVRSENTYTLEYRRESWTQFQSRRPRPRIDLRPLAQRLNLFERAAGTWRAQPLTDPAPRLLLDDGHGRAAPSLIAAETVIDEVLDYLRRHDR